MATRPEKISMNHQSDFCAREAFDMCATLGLLVGFIMVPALIMGASLALVSALLMTMGFNVNFGLF